jgi:hypothetical protein
LVVSSANRRSRRFSQDELVGVKCEDETRVRGEPLLDRRCLVGAAVVEHNVEVLGDFAVDRGQELLELDRSVTRVQAPDDLPAGDVQRGVEARRA